MPVGKGVAILWTFNYYNPQRDNDLRTITTWSDPRAIIHLSAVVIQPISEIKMLPNSEYLQYPFYGYQT
jgi:hypothetical protein